MNKPCGLHSYNINQHVIECCKCQEIDNTTRIDSYLYRYRLLTSELQQILDSSSSGSFKLEQVLDTLDVYGAHDLVRLQEKHDRGKKDDL